MAADNLSSRFPDAELIRDLVEMERRRLGWSGRVAFGLSMAWCLGLTGLAVVRPAMLSPAPMQGVLGAAYFLHIAWIALAPAIVLAPCWTEDRRRATLEGLMLTTVGSEALVRFKMRARLLPWMAILPVGGAAIGVLGGEPDDPLGTAFRAFANLAWCASACLLAAASAALGNTARYGWFGCVVFSLFAFLMMAGAPLVPLLYASALQPGVSTSILLHAAMTAAIARVALRHGAQDLRIYFDNLTQ